MDNSHTRRAIIIFILSASFYLYEYILQVAPSVMVKEIMDSFSVRSVGVGTISAIYFYAYAPMQLPAGMLFDVYGPRLLISLACCICATGAVFFAFSSNVYMASAGRFLIGYGSAFSFIGILILVQRWFKPLQFAMMVGIAQMMSSLGAIFGEIPLAYLSVTFGWRMAIFYLALFGYLLALLVWLVVRDSPKDLPQKPYKRLNLSDEWAKLKSVCRIRQTWAVGLFAFCSWTPISVFGALWVVPYLQRLYGIDLLYAAEASTMIWIGIGVGSPLFGWVSDKIANRRKPLLLSVVIGLITSMYLVIVPSISWIMMHLLLFLIGVAASGQALSFSLVKENNVPHRVGTASGFNNLSVLLGGAIFQPIFGYFLKLNWHGTFEHGTPIYSIASYKIALCLLPFCYLIGILSVLFLIKEPTRRTLSTNHD